MKYIYDILLNFDEVRVYEFYEWNTDDDIEYFKKVPLIRVNDDVFKKIVIGNTINNSSFLDSIYNATEVYDNKRVRRVEYACVIANSNNALGVLLNKNGKILMLSKMLIDEEEESVEIGSTLIEQPLDIKLNNQQNNGNNQFLTRLELKKLFFLNKELDELYANKNIVKLKYIYYECSNKIEEDIDVIYKKVKLFLMGEWNIKHDELYNLVRLSYSKK